MPQRKGPGRPPGAEPPKKSITVLIRQVSLEWIERHLPRQVSRSAFVDEAVAEKIERTKKARPR